MAPIEGNIDNAKRKSHRGKPTCGDIDILITRKDGKSFAGFLTKVIKRYEMYD